MTGKSLRMSGRPEPARRIRWAVAGGALVVLAVTGCLVGARARGWPRHHHARTTTTTTPGAPALLSRVCAGSASVVSAGTVEHPQVDEASGLSAGVRNPDVWWVHNDSGDAPRLFALDQVGEQVATVNLSGADAVDWEDMAVGPAAQGSGGTIYVGDIGDNAQVRPSVQVYRLTEPELTTGGPPSTLTVNAERLTLTYPDGAHDAEALLVDPVRGDLVVLTKDWTMQGRAGVYRAPAGLAAGSTTVLQKMTTLKLPAGALVTAADISPDGSVVAVRTYGAVTLFPRPAGKALWAAFNQPSCGGPAVSEPQGESIGFATDGSSYTTVSEGVQPDLNEAR